MYRSGVYPLCKEGIGDSDLADLVCICSTLAVRNVAWNQFSHSGSTLKTPHAHGSHKYAPILDLELLSPFGNDSSIYEELGEWGMIKPLREERDTSKDISANRSARPRLKVRRRWQRERASVTSTLTRSPSGGPSCRSSPGRSIVAMFVLLGLEPVIASAAPDEIQVYTDDINPVGVVQVETHVNYVLQGAPESSYPRELPSDRVLQFEPEFSYGLTKTLEVGLYFPPVALTPNGRLYVNGIRVRLKYIAGESQNTNFFLGAERRIRL